jgi:K+-transporting ATPase ATPase A chain
VTASSLLTFGLFLGVVTLLVVPVGEYLARVFSGRQTWPDRVLVPTERAIYRLAGIDVHQDMTWREYFLAFIRFSLVVAVAIAAILLLQGRLPLFDADHMTTPMTPDLAFNTAISFSTTTTWQAYGGETTLSYLSQMAAITMGSFLAGAAGLAVGIAFIRGFARTRTDGLGNFWIDITRAMLWVLLPISILGSLFLIWQGVPANLDPYTTVTTVEGGQQTIAQGPVAVLEFIKNLGTNGGGFFNVNGAHPYANPTALTNLVGMLAIVVLPAGLTRTFGRMTGRLREGWLLYLVMVVLFVVGLGLTALFEQGGDIDVASAAGIETVATADQPGGNMEGKETRFGIASSVLTATVTSNAATGSFNSMHDSYTPLGNAVPLTNMLLGELTFGGLGSGLYSLVMMVLVTVFLGGLMVGRVPEYLGKKLGPVETKPVVVYMLVGPATILGLTALTVGSEPGTAGLTANTGAHGFTQILFAYTSANANNGLTMASLNANSPFWNVTTAIAMLAGRFALPALALYVAGMFARQSRRAPTIAVLPTASWTFGALLVGVILIVGALSFFAAVSLGPIADQVAGSS